MDASFVDSEHGIYQKLNFDQSPWRDRVAKKIGATVR
jgi:hypothetical protein